MAQGAATADPLRLGLVTDSLGRLIGANGNATRNLYYLGPLLRARDWESTAASELRAHSLRLARHLCVARPEVLADTGAGFCRQQRQHPGNSEGAGVRGAAVLLSHAGGACAPCTRTP